MSKKTKNKNFRLVIKFRDDLKIDNNVKVNLPQGYDDEANFFFKKVNYKTINLSKKTDIRAKLDQFNKIISDENLKFNFLFKSNSNISVINKLIERSQISKTVDKKKYSNYINFYNYFDCALSETLPDKDINKLIENFKTLLLVPSILDFAYIVPNTVDAFLDNQQDIHDTVPAYTDLITYLGINLSDSNGSKGNDVKIIDIEGSWSKKHSQFSNAAINRDSLLHPILSNSYELLLNTEGVHSEHGTGVLGIIKAKHDKKNDLCKGIAINSIIKFSSVFDNPVDINNLGYTKPEAALLEAIFGGDGVASTSEGDIILIEQYAPPYVLEIHPAIYQLIQFASTQLNIIVVEAAGNGLNAQNASARDLDVDLTQNLRAILESEYTGSNTFWNIYDNSRNIFTDARLNGNIQVIGDAQKQDMRIHSGAIIVGACTYDKTKRIAHCNFGVNTVKVYSLGENILTTVYVAGGSRKSKYTTFAETSGASAIIAGICASLQGTAKANNKLIYPPKMLEYLSNNGTNVQMSAEDSTPIGVVPNYSSIMVALLDDINNNNI